MSSTSSDDERPFYDPSEAIKGFTLELDEAQELAEEIIEMSFEQRFTSSWSEFQEWMAPFFKDLLSSQGLPPDILALFMLSYGDLFTEFQNRTLQSSRGSEVPEDYLIAAVYLGEITDIVRIIARHVEEPETLEKLLSCYTALAARLILLDARDEWEVDDEAIKDIAYKEYYSQLAVGNTPEQEPEEVDVDALRHELLQRGAALAYKRLHISPQQAAELADLSIDEVVEQLDLREQIEFPIQGDLIERLNKVAIEKGEPPERILRQALGSYLPSATSIERWIEEDDPFFSAPTFSSGKSDIAANVDKYLYEEYETE